MNKQFLIWFHEQHKQFVTIEEVREVFLDKTDKMLMQSTPFFDIHPKFGVNLKPKYALGILDIKKTIAFLIQAGDDLKLEMRDLNQAMNGDLVLVEKFKKFNKVVEVVRSSLIQIIAEVRKTKYYTRFISDKEIDRFVAVEQVPDYLVDGHVVLLKVKQITPYQVVAEFKEIIGHKNDPDMDILKIIFEYNWPISFSQDIIKELVEIKVDKNYERKIRRDLRDELIVTIDGADAKDLDDAISVVKEDNKYHVGVHIADVSYFVKDGSLLDDEAYRRGTSVYLADRVIPMLPHGLSNDLCSLNPHEDKYTLTCQMTLNESFDVINYEIFASVIESKKRLTYSAVNMLLKEGVSLGEISVDEMILVANKVGQGLKEKRHQRGAIDFSSSELKFEIDPITNDVLSVSERRTDDAEGLIESLMILANEVVAKHFSDHQLPGIYRVHEKPDEEKLEKALDTVAKLGFIAKNVKKTSQMLQRLTEKSLDTNYQYVVHTQLLRAMQKAKYSEDAIGHFGLGSLYYSHFTSPIRRYPDLFLHRMIHDLVLVKPTKQKIRYYKNMLSEVSDSTSNQERKAISMERDVIRLKSCSYMENKVGEVFEGMIVSLTQSGMFVKLDNGIEGFIALRDLNMFLNYDETQLLFYTHQGKQYKLGDKVSVKLIAVNMVEKQISFVFSDMNHEIKPKGVKHESHRPKQKSNPRLRNRRKV